MKSLLEETDSWIKENCWAETWDGKAVQKGVELTTQLFLEELNRCYENGMSLTESSMKHLQECSRTLLEKIADHKEK